jgi:hypothetical protein
MQTGERQLTDAAITPLNILNGDWRISRMAVHVVFVNGSSEFVLLELPEE